LGLSPNNNSKHLGAKLKFRAKLVSKLDRYFPSLMAKSRYAYHVKLKRSQVYPDVLDKIFRDINSHQKIAVDVGANRGVFTLYFSDHFKKCIAIEPVPDLAAQLSRAMPKNVDVLPCAIGDTRGTVELRIPVSANGTKLHALSTAASDNSFDVFEHSTVETIVVSQETLDHICAGPDEIGFVKIDVEGYEGTVLRGAQALIQKHRPYFFVEIFQGYNKDYRDVFKMFSDLNYIAFKLSSDLPVQMDDAAVELLGNQKFTSDGAEYFDYLFVPDAMHFDLISQKSNH
jgi:FkbM family methyltransferase